MTFNKGNGKERRVITSFRGTPQKRTQEEITREARQKLVNKLYPRKKG